MTSRSTQIKLVLAIVGLIMAFIGATSMFFPTQIKLSLSFSDQVFFLIGGILLVMVALGA
jgi:hypothetical protein